jgi:HTH-type transcriptional regulator, quorum sensing regulator NprR
VISLSTVSYRLKELRKKAGLTQNDLAEGIVNRSYISQIEKGRVQPSYKLLQAFCERLNCSISELITDSELEGIVNIEFDRELKAAEEYLEKKEYLMAEEKLKHIDLDNDDLNNHQLGVYHFCVGDIFEHQYDENEKAKDHFKRSVDCFMKKNYIYEKLRSQNHLAQILIKQDRIIEAFNVLDEAYEEVVFNKVTGLERISLIVNLGIVHGRLGEYYSAIRLLKQANELNQSTEMFYKSGVIYMVLGLCNRRIERISEAKACYEKAIEFLRCAEDMKNLAGTYINLGILLRRTNNLVESEQYLNLAKRIYMDINDLEGLDNAIYEICRTKLSLEEYTEGEKIALKYLNESNTESAIINKLYLVLGEIKSKQGRDKEAITYYKSALESAEGKASDEIKVLIAEAFHHIKDYEQSSYYYFHSKPSVKS